MAHIENFLTHKKFPCFKVLLLWCNLQENECKVLDENIGKDNGEENALWYFREDVQLNYNHLIWHSYYSFKDTSKVHRRGEFFYYFHHVFLARYF